MADGDDELLAFGAPFGRHLGLTRLGIHHERLLPGRSPGQLVRILELLAAVTPFATRPIEEMVLHEATRVPWGCTLVIVTAIAHDALLATIMHLAAAGRPCVLFTLAEKPPTRFLPNVTVYHLPHLIEELIVPELI